MVKYRIANKKDYEAINSFHNKIYSSNRTIKQFYWEFHYCPFGKSIYVIAEDKQKIIGTNCVIPIELIDSNNQIILSGKSEDTLVDPEYRGQNVFYNIYHVLFDLCKKNGIKVIWGFTSAKKPFKKLGFTIPFEHQQSIAVNKIFSSYRHLIGLNSKNKVLDKLKIFGLCLYSKSRVFIKNKNLLLEKYNITVQEQIVEGINDLIKSNLSNPSSLFYISQSNKFQKWRIYDNPNYHNIYTFGFYNDENILQGLIIINSDRNKVGYISQSTFHASLDESVAVRMLKFATDNLFDLGIILIRNWQFNHNVLNRKESECFNKANHVHLKKGISLVWKELDGIDIRPEMFYLSRIATQGLK